MWDVLPAADEITQGFGCTSVVGEWPTPKCPSGWYHSGIDLGAAAGGWSIFRRPVYATRPGVVVRCGYPNGLGPQAVFIQTDGGPCLIYGHLDAATVSVGQRVKPGDQIGLLGTKGFSIAPHLHFEARSDGARQPISGQDPITGVLDPTPYLTNQGGVMFDTNDRATLIKLTLAGAAGGFGILLTDAELDSERVKVHDNLDNLQSVIGEIVAAHPKPNPTGAHTHQ